MDNPPRQTEQNKSVTNSKQEDSQMKLSTPLVGPGNNANICDEHNQDTNGERNPAIEMGLWNKVKETSATDRIMAAGTFVIAVATCFYTFFSFQQWGIMEKQLLEQRAWVGPTLVLPAEYTDGTKKVYVKTGEPIKCGIVITNSGKTPAKNVQHSIVVQALKAGEEPILKESTGQRDISVLQPGMTLTINYPPITGVSNTNVNALSSGKDIIFMYGIIRYEDIFKRAHWTKFCMYVAPDLATFSSCPYNNDTDDKY